MDIRICDVCWHKNPKEKVYCEKCGNKFYDAFMRFFSRINFKNGK